VIVIPMAGASRRFTEAGYARPKYELMLDGRMVFDHAVAGFAAYFGDTAFAFITGPTRGAARFVDQACRRLGIADARIVALDAPTAGQAETVERGLAGLDVGQDEPLTIFNIDTFRPGFRFPSAGWTTVSDGWLEVFRGEGVNWSYVRPAHGAEPLALETAEKRPISDLCCTGLYHFARAADFSVALARERASPSMNELYVAPLYNHLIAAGRRIHYQLIARAEAIFCGTPDEYQALGGAPPGTERQV
jgi:hypothetical protein